jgi:hypothetical protein
VPRRYAVDEGGVLRGSVVDAEGSQGRYTRGSVNATMSDELQQHRQCVADKLKGTNPGSRQEARENFEEASNECQ